MRYLATLVFLLPHLLLAHPPYSTAEIHRLGYPSSLHWIDISDLEKKYQGQPPMHVGIDIDDALLFTSAIMSRVLADHPGKSFRDIPDMYAKMNCDYVRFSMPKAIGYDIIRFHQQRGDKVYFITARQASPCVNTQYSINDYIRETFSLQAMHPVIFTETDFGQGSKMQWLKAHHIALYYGDSDSDIKAAQDAGAYGVRIMRASNSLKMSENNIGLYQEPVLRGSDR